MKRIKSKTYLTLIKRTWDHYLKNEIEEAKLICDKIRSEYEQDVESLYILGCIAFDAKDYVNAAENLRFALNNDYDRTRVGYIHYMLGKTYAEDPFLETNPVLDKQAALHHFNAAKSEK
jgi:hypothetical protein